MKRLSLLSAGVFACCLSLSAQTSAKLTGTVIGTRYSVNYNTGGQSTTVNTKDNAFDGNLSTFFASYDRSNTWCGLDLGTPHVITKVGWSPRNDSQGPARVCLAVFEGANKEDFSDAVPLYLTSQNGTIGTISYSDVSVSRAFRYVRYVGPNEARCNVAEVEFYGYEGEGSDAVFYQPTNLPVVVIHSIDGKDPVDKVNDKPARVTIISHDGMEVLEDSATFRLRGNASMGFPKKPYRIKFNKKHNVLGSPAKAKKWTLINNYGDKTLMRNMIAFEISRRMQMAYTPFCTPVDVIVNGEYKGCYQLCDQIEVGKNRVDIEELDATCVNKPELTGGYFIEIDAYATGEDLYFYSKKNNPVTVKYPDAEDIVDQQLSYLKGRFNTMEARLFASNFTNPTDGYRALLDLDSFLQHFIVGELSGNTDTYWSTNMYKHRDDEHFYTGPVWDFDLAFENDNRTYPINSKRDYVYRSGGSYAGNMKSFVDRIIVSDAGAKQRLKELWSIARNSYGLTSDSLVAYVRANEQLLDASQKLNFMRWKIMNSYVHQNPKVYGSYSGEVNNVVNYIQNRFTWLDNKIGYDPDLVAIQTLGDDSASDDEIGPQSMIYDLSGSVIAHGSIDALPAGIYLVRNQTKSFRVLKADF